MRRFSMVALGVLGVTIGCRESRQVSQRADSNELRARADLFERRLASTPGGFDAGTPVARWILPRALREVSGIALTADGRLLTHDDEHGEIFVIDPRRGAVLKSFLIGPNGTRADFEGITIANGTIYVVTSNGNLFEFAEGANGESVAYTVHETRLGRECEFEGVAYDSAAQALILPCKTIGLRKDRHRLVLYRWALRRDVEPRITKLTIPEHDVIGSHDWQSVHPTDIAVDPATGHYVLIAARENALVEITPAGGVVRSAQLPKIHRQAEGVTITPDGLLIVSDEGTRSAPTITLYRWPSSAATHPASP